MLQIFWDYADDCSIFCKNVLDYIVKDAYARSALKSQSIEKIIMIQTIF